MKIPAKLAKYLCIIIVLIMLPVGTFSQGNTSCAEKLKNAQAHFDRGQVERVPEMLGGCLKSGFNREESLAAYKLLIQTYLFEDKLDLADSVMLSFLKRYPEYEVSQTDHTSFVHLLNTFNVKPSIQLSFHFGNNIPFLTFINSFPLSSVPGNKEYSTETINIYTSAEIKFQLANRMEVNFEAGYSRLSFSRTEQFMDFAKIGYSETQNRIELPVSLTYNIHSFGKFALYSRIGVGPAFIMGSSAKASFIPLDLNNTNSQSDNDIDRNDSRISIDFFTQIGAGLKYKTNGGFITAEVRSNLGLINQTVRNGASATELNAFYKYNDDNFNFNALNISIGYTQIFYNASKKKSKL